MFSVTKFMADAQLEDFEYLGRNDEPCTVPHLRSLPLGLMARMEAGDWEALDEIQPGLRDEFETLPHAAADALIAEWRKHSGLDSGESDASSPSSKGNTAGLSKPTSRATSKSRTRKR